MEKSLTSLLRTEPTEYDYEYIVASIGSLIQDMFDKRMYAFNKSKGENVFVSDHILAFNLALTENQELLKEIRNSYIDNNVDPDKLNEYLLEEIKKGVTFPIGEEKDSIEIVEDLTYLNNLLDDNPNVRITFTDEELRKEKEEKEPKKFAKENYNLDL